jgi:phage baseplate assembly protein W
MAKTILSGISFPFRISKKGLPAEAKGTDVIRSALIVLLRTGKRKRVMRPTLGTSIRELLFETNGPIQQSLVRREILSLVSNFLPEVKITEITFKTDRNDEHKLEVNIAYVIQGVQDETGFVVIGGV